MMSKASGQATISQKDCGHYFASLAVGVTPQLHRRRSEKLFSRGARGLDAGRLEAVETREALSRGSSVAFIDGAHTANPASPEGTGGDDVLLAAAGAVVGAGAGAVVERMRCRAPTIGGPPIANCCVSEGEGLSSPDSLLLIAAVAEAVGDLCRGTSPG